MRLGLSHTPRVITGLGMAAALVACLVTGGLAVQIALSLVAVAAIMEFYFMLWPGKERLVTKIFGLIFTVGILFCAAIEYQYGILFILCAACIYTALCFLFDYSRGNDTARIGDHTSLLFGLLYIPIPLQLAFSLNMQEQFLVIVAVIASDTFAYYAGCLWGKRKIWPRVSPNKSWMGSSAGLLGCVIATTLMGLFVFTDSKILTPTPPWWFWILLGVVLNIFAQLGDFFESALKRVHNVKDSSFLLPGHGGVLDRIDSLLFALVAYHFMGVLFRYWHINLMSLFMTKGV